MQKYSQNPETFLAAFLGAFLGAKAYKATIFDIRHVTKLAIPEPGSFYTDPEVNQMTFQVLNAALYHKNIDKIVQDIATFAPDVIMIGWCYSQFGDLSLALRRSAQFSKMIITHDLREVTKKPTAKLDDVQEKLLNEIGIELHN